MFHMTLEMYGKINDLARLIKAADEYRVYEKAQEKCRREPAAQRCQQALAAFSQRFEKAHGDLPLLNALLHEQEELLAEQSALPCVAELQKARAAVSELVRGTAEALQGILFPDVQCSCSGNCQDCGGCGAQE